MAPSLMPEWLRNDDSEVARTIKTSGLYYAKHAKWGFVVVRSAYGDEAKWSLAMKRMRQHLQMSFVANNRKKEDGSDDPTIQMIMRLFQPVILEDEDELDGADYDTIREHYRDWVDEHKNDPEFWDVHTGVCLFIDEKFMNDLANAPEPSLWWWHCDVASVWKTKFELSVGALDPEFDGGPDQPSGLDDTEDDEEYFPYYHGWMWVSIGSLLRLWDDVTEHSQSMEHMCPRAEREGLIPIYDGYDGIFLDAETMERFEVKDDRLFREACEREDDKRFLARGWGSRIQWYATKTALDRY